MFTKKYLYRLIIPLIFEQILAVTVGIADSMMVASAGEAAVAGVSIVDTINVLLIGLFAALATGGAVVSAQFLGHKEHENACMAAEQLVLTTAALSMVIMAISLIGRNLILKYLFGNVDADVMVNAQLYFFYSALSYPFIAIYNASAALFRSMGNSRVSLATAFLMNVINVVGNAILIFVFDMGVAGAAIATLISRMVAAMILIYLLRNQKQVIHLRQSLRFHFNPIMIKRILRIGVPNGLENSMFQIGKILVQGLVTSFGRSAITANAVASSVVGMATLPGSAIGLALITIVGQCIGAGESDSVKRYTFKLMKVAHIIMGVINIFLIILCPFILKLYHLSDETIMIATRLMIYHCAISTFLWPTSFALPNALRAANDVKYTMVVSIVSMWVWRIGFSYILAKYFGLGVFGVWIAMTIDWLFRSICFVTRFLQAKYKQLSYL